jgi:hypothetical protein
MNARILVAAIAICMTFMSVSRAQAAGPFSLSGHAQIVTGGVGPNNSAVDLTSNCGAEPFNPTCYNDPTFTFSDLGFTPSGSLTVSGITTLSTDYNFGGANCGGGSPRVALQGSSRTITCGYFGQNPINFTSCYTGWLNTGNWASAADTRVRWDDHCNGTAAHDWAGVLATYGSQTVTEVDLIVDGGWFDPRGQDLTIDNFTVNGSVTNGENVH